MAKTYRSALGKNVDLDRILNSNETTRAVGNMNVNARGDTIDSQNKTVQSRNERIKNQYRKQHKTAVVDQVVPTSKRHAQKIANMEAQIEASKTNAERIAEEYSQPVVAKPIVKDTQPQEEVAAPQSTVEPVIEAMQEKAPAGGLAAAIAKARESKQEVMKTERQQAREDEGVKRI